MNPFRLTLKTPFCFRYNEFMHNEIVRKFKRLEHAASILFSIGRTLRTRTLEILLKSHFNFVQLFKNPTCNKALGYR